MLWKNYCFIRLFFLIFCIKQFLFLCVFSSEKCSVSFLRFLFRVKSCFWYLLTYLALLSLEFFPLNFLMYAWLNPFKIFFSSRYIDAWCPLFIRNVYFIESSVFALDTLKTIAFSLADLFAFQCILFFW